MKTNEKTRLKNKRWRDANPEMMQQARNNWVKNNKEYEQKRLALKQAKYREQNPEKHKEALNQWRANNKEHIREYNRKWRQSHRVELALHQRARNAGTKNKVIKEDIANWHTRICGICSLLIEDKFHIDHKIPLAKGGLHEVSNLQLTHPSCNLRKKDRLQVIDKVA